MTIVDEKALQRTDDEKIRAAALDYMEGWYTADAARMERALHPDLVKRAYVPGADGNSQLLHLSALALVQFTRGSNDKSRRAEVSILDRFQGSASVRATMADWVDYMHIVKVGAEWKIINILWEYTEAEWIARGGTAGERTR
jgi:hypothetical protein